MAFDNYKGLTGHMMMVDAIQANTYFTRPYTRKHKGTVENRIGQLRRFFPKKTDLSAVTDRLIKQVEQYLNYTPVRKFNYIQLSQVLHEKDCTYYLNLENN